MKSHPSPQPALLFRPCTLADLPALLEIALETFDETFRPMNSPETMQAYIETAFTPEQFAAELAEPRSRFYFLYRGPELAGYLKLNEATAQTDLNEPDTLEIERIYVRTVFKGLGLGRYLVEQAISLARQGGMKSLWLGVWQKNTAAIGFYHRMGFRTFASHTFVMGEEHQTDDLMRLEIGD
jgi:ribosomal protein S18 acetylase RimI-like enzyme